MNEIKKAVIEAVEANTAIDSLEFFLTNASHMISL